MDDKQKRKKRVSKSGIGRRAVDPSDPSTWGYAPRDVEAEKQVKIDEKKLGSQAHRLEKRLKKEKL